MVGRSSVERGRGPRGRDRAARCRGRARRGRLGRRAGRRGCARDACLRAPPGRALRRQRAVRDRRADHDRRHGPGRRPGRDRGRGGGRGGSRPRCPRDDRVPRPQAQVTSPPSTADPGAPGRTAVGSDHREGRRPRGRRRRVDLDVRRDRRGFRRRRRPGPVHRPSRTTGPAPAQRGWPIRRP